MQGHVLLLSFGAAQQCQGLFGSRQNICADVGQLFWALCLTLRDATCRAFALEGRGIWHALSASVAQQLIGPVRIRADFRFALDLPSSIPQVSSTPPADAHHRMAPGRQRCKLQCTFPHTCQLSAFTLQDEEGRRGWKSIGSAAASVRPSLLEAVYGADMVIPGALLLGSLNSCLVTAML